MPQKILRSFSKFEMGSISVVSPIWKTILKNFAALLQLLNFRIFLFLKFFAKSINKLTRGDYVSWGTIVKTKPNTEITRFDGIGTPFTCFLMSSPGSAVRWYGGPTSVSYK